MSKKIDLLLTGGQVVTGNKITRANIAVNDGKIKAVLPPNKHPPAYQYIDADGLHILPGIIDTHVHLRDPARPDREDFRSGTSAAAAGGITTILEMPISEPPTNSGPILTERRHEVQQRALVDFALYGAVGHDNVHEVQGMAEAGAIAFKTFLTAAPPNRDAEFAGLCCPNMGDLPRVMQAVAQTSLRHCFHCEHEDLLQTYIGQMKAARRGDGLAHAESRPPLVEDVSVASVLAIAAETRTPVQIVHLSSLYAAQLAKDAKAQGLDVTVETCPQYLFLTFDELRKHGPFAKCNPALRSHDEMETLWGYLFDGTIDVIGSDHSPYRPEEKEQGLVDVFKATAGMPGLEPMLPLMLTAVNQGRLTLPQLVQFMSQRAAALFRLGGKGNIAPDYDADFTLVDMSARWTFDRHQCFSKAKDLMRAYHGREMEGKVVSTLVRGKMVYHEGKIVAKAGHGHFLRPTP